MTNKDFAFINQQAINAVKTLKKAEYDLIKVLQKVDEKKVYAYYGFRSLFQYSLSALHLTESQAYSYINVARKSQQCPALDEALKNKEISVSKLKQVIAQITPSNQTEWIDRVKTMSKRELENLVAKSNPHIRIPEQARMVAENLIHLQMPISENRFKKFQRVNELLCQKTNKVIKMQDIVEQLCDFYIEKNDPLKKAERAEKRIKRKPNRITLQNKAKPIVASQTNRAAIPSSIQNQVYLRDQGCCQFLDATGKKCRERRWLDYHHVIPVKKGGEHSLKNLTLLCRGHHRSLHFIT